MRLNPLKWPLSFTAGISAIVIFWLCTLISVLLFPGNYNPTKNWMSNLGNSNYNPNGAIFFNIGCIITGILLFPFYIGLFEYSIGNFKNKILTKLTQVIGFLSAFSIIMIGVFPEDNLQVHSFWATVLFFSTMPILFLPSIALYQYDFSRNIAKYGFIASAINVLLWVVFIPIIEWITIIFAFGFIGIMIENLNRRIDKYRFIRKNLKANRKLTKKRRVLT